MKKEELESAAAIFDSFAEAQHAAQSAKTFLIDLESALKCMSGVVAEKEKEAITNAMYACSKILAATRIDKAVKYIQNQQNQIQ